MIIREPNLNDTQAIIELLQLSLGESLLKKTVAIWDFKHIANPFGQSYVLVAEEDDVIVGVRAFMQWRWQLEDKVWTSYRAVDTATHPAYQGKGIFKRLTLRALDDVQAKGECFVFNTPNNQSRPGYLKMGWQEVGKINVALIPSVLNGFEGLFSTQVINNSISTEQLEKLCELHNAGLKARKNLFTPKSPGYLKWRYEENLLQKYHVISTSDFYIAMCVKKHRFYKELRVVEILGSFQKETYSQVRSSIVRFALKEGCWLITCDDKKLFRFSFFGAYGPKLTFRALTSDTNFIKKALEFKNWKYSIGDLELF